MADQTCAHCAALIRRSEGGLLWRDDRGFRFCGNVAAAGPARMHHPAATQEPLL